MMKLQNLNYNTKEIKYRSMRICELIHAISCEMFENGDENKECRFVWTDTAEVTKIDGVKGLHNYPFNLSALVRVYGFSLVCMNNGDEFYKVILEDTGLE